MTCTEIKVKKSTPNTQLALSPSKQRNTSTNTSAKKPRETVAHRLHMLPSPTFSHPMPKIDDDRFIVETQKVDSEMREATEELKIVEWEAEMAKRRLAAEETRRKTLQIQKQAEWDQRKAAQERARYDREFKKAQKT